MIITYLGGEFVKVQFGDITLAFNPPAKGSKLPITRFGADIVLSTLNDVDMNGIETVTHGDRKPFVVSGPGAYEIKGVAVRGYATESEYGKEKRINTVYTVLLEGMKLCFLGALGNVALPAELKEELDDVDILFTPIGGEGVLSAADANKLAVQLEPRLVIPIHYAGIGDSSALKIFLKEAGEDNPPAGGSAVEKLTLKKKDLEGKEGEIVVLKAGQ